jgi:hypothetical protein
MSIADAFDAMTSTRSYRNGMSLDKAIEIIKINKGTQFDELLSDIFIDMANKNQLSHILAHSSEEKLMLSCPQCGPVIAPSIYSNDGDSLICPSCTGEHIMHKKGDSYELEWKGSMTGIYIPAPDTETIDYILRNSLKYINL